MANITQETAGSITGGCFKSATLRYPLCSYIPVGGYSSIESCRRNFDNDIIE